MGSPLFITGVALSSQREGGVVDDDLPGPGMWGLIVYGMFGQKLHPLVALVVSS